MAVREVLMHPDPLLTLRAERMDPEVVAPIAEDLLDTMRSYGHCVGIAAPQIGESVRVVVVDCTGHPKALASHGLLVLVNPEIVEASGSEIGREGCLSIPEFTANVRRATRIVVESEGMRFESSGFEARVIQHEIDHLDGLLFLDRVESLEADVFRRKRR